MPLFIQRRTGCCPAATYRALLLGSLVAIVAIVPLGLHPGLQTAQAQEYPSRPIRIIAPSTPGGGFDLVARVLGNQLSQQMGQQIVVENRPGGGTLLGTQTIARAPADGYHLLVGGFAIVPAMSKVRYDPVADFVPLRIVVSHSYTLIARKDLAQSTLKDVFAFARANPGKLTIGSSGPGSGQYILAMFVRSLGNVDILMVPYKGAQPVYQDLLAGRVDLFFDNSTTTRSYLQSGQAKALAVSSRQRAPDAPQVPTINETGAFQLEMETWFGWFAPAKTPPAVVERLRAELDKATQLAEIRTRLEQNAGRSLRMSSAESEAFVKAEVSKWTGLMKQAGIVPE